VSFSPEAAKQILDLYTYSEFCQGLGTFRSRHCTRDLRLGLRIIGLGGG
jgi:hypothetical protein